MSKLLFTGSEWSFDLIEKTWKVIDDVGKNVFKLDYPKTQMEMVTYEQMLDNNSSIGMPSMYEHWSFGKQYIQEHKAYTSGKMGLSYEMVINTDPTICYLMENNSMTMQTLVMAHANCVDKDTEVLTPEGWIKMDEYNGQQIAQYSEDGKVHFEKPLRYISIINDKFLHIKARGVDQMVTMDHTLVYKTPEGNLKKQSAEKYMYQHSNKTRGHNGKFITHFKLKPHRILMCTENELRLQVAIKADGSRQGNKYRFHLKKQRKIDRLEQLLRSQNIEYTKTDTYEGRVSISFHFYEIPKVMSWEYLLDTWAAKIVAEEVLLWDGNLEQETFSTTIKESADIIQAIWASLGYGTSITTSKIKGKKDCYSVKRGSYNERSISRSRGGKPNQLFQIRSHDMKAYCFTTNTGMWLSRRDNCIAITGNCGHGSFFKQNYLFKEWTQPDTILDYLVFAKNYIKDCEYKYGNEKVEITLDAAHSLQYHGMDYYKRKGSMKKSEIERRKKKWLEHLTESISPDWDIDDLKKNVKDIDSIVTKLGQDRRGYPEENILYFLEKYSPTLETWQKEILRIVRKLAQYFYPQMQTKLMNEGWASFIHHKIMTRLHDDGRLTDGSYLEFLNSHTSVCCQPSYKEMSGFNPYALGYAMFKDIERVCKDPTEEDRYWFPDFAGEKDWLEVCKEAVELYRDETFILNYLSPKVIRDFKMFSIYDDEDLDFYRVDEVHSDEDVIDLKDKLSKLYSIINNIPQLEITGVDWEDTRALEVTQTVKNGILLDRDSSLLVTEYLGYLWGYPIEFDVKEIKDQ